LLYGQGIVTAEAFVHYSRRGPESILCALPCAWQRWRWKPASRGRRVPPPSPPGRPNHCPVAIPIKGCTLLTTDGTIELIAVYSTGVY
jgi:hypothetical protein